MPTRDDHDHQAAEALPEVVEEPLRGQPGQLGQQRGLDGLEHEQRHPGHEHRVAELGDDGVLVGVGQQVGGDGAGVDQRGGGDGAGDQPAQVRGDLAPLGRRDPPA